MTYEEFEEKLLSEIIPNRDENIRSGQALMNYLSTINWDEYLKITSTEFDCYYNDRLVPKTLKYLKNVWRPV